MNIPSTPEDLYSELPHQGNHNLKLEQKISESEYRRILPKKLRYLLAQLHRPPPPMFHIKSLHQAHPMRRRRCHNQHVENLMARAPDIVLARAPFLRYACGIDACAENVQRTLGDDPVETSGLPHMGEPIELDAVQHWDDGGEAHCDEHEGAEGAKSRSAEFAVERYHGGAES